VSLNIYKFILVNLWCCIPQLLSIEGCAASAFSLGQPKGRVGDKLDINFYSLIFVTFYYCALPTAGRLKVKF